MKFTDKMHLLRCKTKTEDCIECQRITENRCKKCNIKTQLDNTVLCVECRKLVIYE